MEPKAGEIRGTRLPGASNDTAHPGTASDTPAKRKHSYKGIVTLVR